MDKSDWIGFILALVFGIIINYIIFIVWLVDNFSVRRFMVSNLILLFIVISYIYVITISKPR